MTLKQYLFLMTVGTITCWIAWICVLINIDPFTAGWLMFVFFYTSLFLGIIGAVSIIGLFIQTMIIKSEEIIFRNVKKTLKQGVIIGIFTVITLFLKQLQFLRWWNAIFIFILFVLVEGIVLSNRKYLNRDYV